MLEAGPMIARGLVALLATLRSQIAGFEQRFEELVRSHPRRRAVCLPTRGWRRTSPGRAPIELQGETPAPVAPTAGCEWLPKARPDDSGFATTGECANRHGGGADHASRQTTALLEDQSEEDGVKAAVDMPHFHRTMTSAYLFPNQRKEAWPRIVSRPCPGSCCMRIKSIPQAHPSMRICCKSRVKAG